MIDMWIGVSGLLTLLFRYGQWLFNKGLSERQYKFLHGKLHKDLYSVLLTSGRWGGLAQVSTCIFLGHVNTSYHSWPWLEKTHWSTAESLSHIYVMIQKFTVVIATEIRCNYSHFSYKSLPKVQLDLIYFSCQISTNVKYLKMCKIWGSQSGVCEEFCLTGYNVM
jgi:hypothetical protein